MKIEARMRPVFLHGVLLCGLLFGFCVYAEDARPAEEVRLQLPYVSWDAFMLGIDSPEKIQKLKKAQKRVPVVGLVTVRGLNRSIHESLLTDGREIEYVMGQAAAGTMHDDYQISEVLQIVRHLGLAFKLKVFHAASGEIGKALDAAGKECEIVITYSSFWGGLDPMFEAIAANPKTLYIGPYAEITGQPPTGTSLQGGARHPDGSGHRNFITAIPLSRHSKGALLTPSRRDKNDFETINFVAPSSYASNQGVTCPSVGVTAIVAAYIASFATKPVSAKRIIKVMKSGVCVPEKWMLRLADFDDAAVKTLREHLKDLTSIDQTGIRRLEAEGVLNLWNVYSALTQEQ